MPRLPIDVFYPKEPDYGPMYLVRRSVSESAAADARALVRAELDRIGPELRRRVSPGERIALAVSQNDITDHLVVIREVAACIRRLGAEPFIVPGVGSHGRTLPEVERLAAKGITEASVGVPIRSTLDVAHLGQTTALGRPIDIYLDRYAWEADHLVVINRVEQHHEMTADFGAGLMKMLCIGLSNHVGATYYHRVMASEGYARVIRTVAGELLATGKVLFGMGIVQNTRRQTCALRCALSEAYVETELELFRVASGHALRLPYEELDVLIIDELLGRSAMAFYVIGRLSSLAEPTPTRPRIKRVFVRDMHPSKGGEAIGIGRADYTTTRLVEKLDHKQTYATALRGLRPEDARIPMHFDTDREVMKAVMNTIGDVPARAARIVRIVNTTSLRRMLVSEACLAEVRARDDLHVEAELGPLTFGADGNLPPWPTSATEVADEPGR